MAPFKDTSFTFSKGLLNRPGQNNCFLNSAVQEIVKTMEFTFKANLIPRRIPPDILKSKKHQIVAQMVLWHLDIFRRSFRELSGHTCMLDSCIFCALKELFSQLQFSHESALPPDALRRALAESFFDQQRFQLGFMDDAAECFENILLRIHFHLANSEAEDCCNARHCIPHVKFAMTLVEQSVCGACGATSEPLPFTQMVHYVSASALISQAKQAPSPSHPDLFGQLLKRAGGMGDIRDCPSACGAKIQIRRTLTNHPEIVSVGIVWDSDRPSIEHIVSLLVTLRTTLKLSDVFHTPPPLPTPSNSSHQLVGIVTYYGKHYSTFFFHTKLKIWIYFDDANVREVGPKWEQVVEKCRKGRYQPLLLLFASPDGTPVDSTSAPKTIAVAPRAVITKSEPQARRSLTPSPEKPCIGAMAQQRRALTPNPQQQQAADNLTKLQCHNGVISEYQNVTQLQKSLASPTRVGPNWGQNGTLRRMGSELVRRDSGNWSGDRNSASSSSSTSLENPYQYIIGKMHNRSQVVPRSPTSLKGGESSSGGSQCDPGYDSYSLSSTDSLPLQQTLKHNLQLAQIPEGHQSPVLLANMQIPPKSGQSECERLCDEADMLLKHSQATDDLEMALSYANAAVGKARQAMDAPYSNPQSASAARMKHNTCIMQARSLHKRLEEPNGPRHAEGRHSREGSGCSGRASTGSHSRQNSRDKTHHSRQNSREMLTVAAAPEPKPPEPVEKSPEKTIEIYATLPKSRKGLLSRTSSKVKTAVEDEEYLMYDRPGRSLTRAKPPNGKKEEKRARSEERNKSQKESKEKEFVSSQLSKEAKKQAKNEEQKEKQSKKQHKIRRKLLMGGLIRRKNRSMPDLREDEVAVKGMSKDDTNLGKVEKQGGLSGYLSEGHLDYSGNPNLERSKLMRKSFHGSKLLHMAKVPPPPPLRTTSQLSKSERPPFPLPDSYDERWNDQPQSLPPMSESYSSHTTDAVTYANGGYLLGRGDSKVKLVTTAQVHQVGSPVNETIPPPDDEFVLPPYPSPLNSVSHSRQASEDFPPPPNEVESLNPSTLLEQLQMKRQQILNDNGFREAVDTVDCAPRGGDNWLRELQAKQAAIKSRDQDHCKNYTVDQGQIQDQEYSQGREPKDELNSVKDLKSKFESITVRPNDAKLTSKEECISSSPLTVSDRSEPEEIRSNLMNTSRLEELRRKPKKKNVTFCEQVVLVATAEEDKSNSYIPNPILERVLRSVLHREPQETKEVAVHSVVPLKRNDSGSYGQCAARTPAEIKEIFEDEIGTPVDSADKVQMPQVNEKSVEVPPNRPFQRMLPSPMPTRQVTRITPIQVALSHPSVYNGSKQDVTNNGYQMNSLQCYQDEVRSMNGSLPRDVQTVKTHLTEDTRYSQPLGPTKSEELTHDQELLRAHMNALNRLHATELSSTDGSGLPPQHQQIYASQSYNQAPHMMHAKSQPISIPHQMNQNGLSPYQTVPMPVYNGNIAKPTNGGQIRPQLPTGQVTRNIPSPVVHGQMQRHMNQTMNQSYQHNGYQLKNPSPVPASFHSEQHHPVPNCNPQMRPYAHQLQQSVYAQQQMNGSGQIVYMPPTSASLTANSPSPSLSIKSLHQPHQTQAYMPLPQKMRTQQNGLMIQPKARPQTMYQHESPGDIQRKEPQVYQRVPNPMGLQNDYQINYGHPVQMNQNQYSPTTGPPQMKFSPYQHPPPPRQMEMNKTTGPQPNRTNMCNLCRKKSAAIPSIYCADCDFYMSRFKPRT